MIYKLFHENDDVAKFFGCFIFSLFGGGVESFSMLVDRIERSGVFKVSKKALTVSLVDLKIDLLLVGQSVVKADSLLKIYEAVAGTVYASDVGAAAGLDDLEIKEGTAIIIKKIPRLRLVV